MSRAGTDQRIRSLRPPKARVDAFAAQGSLVEDERRPDGRIERALTVFLTGAECPFTCSFCDLWRYTLDGPTPPGALTKQLERAIDGVSADRLKLYNASNFFDTRAVPREDLPAIAKLADSFSHVTVESHANTVGPATIEFACMIRGRLEVAIGLETIHPVALQQINKRLDLERFDRAAGFLRENEIDLRVLVLLGAPFIEGSESIEWTTRTVDYAASRGASVISIIPVRGGNGEMERLEALGDFTPPRLSDLELALENSAGRDDCVVTADLWDINRFSHCNNCIDSRVDRLRRINITGRIERRVACDFCSPT